MSKVMLFFLSIIILTNFLHSTTLNGRLLSQASNDSIVEVKVQINTDTGIDDLGGATIVLTFDTTNFYYPDSPIVNLYYIFHNFWDGNYDTSFITKPFPNELWINIDLQSANNGTVISGINSWTDVVTLFLRLKNGQSPGSVNFDPNSPYWAIFDGDNTTFWENGIFSTINDLDIISESPEQYALKQNFPNPFNPSTKIRISLSSESDVKIEVYNLLGELIRTLINNKIAAGNHEIIFESDGLPSGIYIYRFESENYMDSKKMILLK